MESARSKTSACGARSTRTLAAGSGQARTATGYRAPGSRRCERPQALVSQSATSGPENLRRAEPAGILSAEIKPASTRNIARQETDQAKCSLQVLSVVHLSGQKSAEVKGC